MEFVAAIGRQLRPLDRAITELDSRDLDALDEVVAPLRPLVYHGGGNRMLQHLYVNSVLTRRR